MSQLVLGMYGTEFHHESNLFGLGCGQLSCSDKKITHNSGWYNKRGEKLGWGDLSAEDFQRIATEIAADEVFVVLGEDDSYWNVRNGQIKTGLIFKQVVTEASPGIDYVAAHAQFLIAKGQLCRVHSFRYFRETQEEDRSGLRFKIISNREVAKIMYRSGAL